MAISITAAMLYDLVHCPHRVHLELFGDPGSRDAVSPFVQLLWERGQLYEKEVISNLRQPFLDLSGYAGDEKERLTLEAMDRGEALIYSGRIRAGDLLGDPDLLRNEGRGYIAGDIKSGAGEEGGGDGEDGTPKAHYAAQLALYTSILEALRRSSGRRAFVWDIHGQEVLYDFTELHGKRNPRTLWQDFEDVLASAREIIAGAPTLPAYGSACKNCIWLSPCIADLEKANDLTLIHELGRFKRDAMISHVGTVRDFAAVNLDGFIKGKKTVFDGIGVPTLSKLHGRARILSSEKPSPVLKAPIALPRAERELFFDIEVDPMRDVCYLHGFVERRGGDNDSERFVYFLAEEPTAAHEERAFAQAWEFMHGAHDAAIYYYSKYERTIYRKLREKYPTVCTEGDLSALFDPSRAIDLYYDVVLKATDWPTRDYSIKTLAKHLGFTWSDPHPSGAASIEWFHRWVKTRDSQIRDQILRYNEDDCRATRVLLDGIRRLADG